jgi:8-oxo-dGTP pyrophosphatase MutT (NUDIX family)
LLEETGLEAESVVPLGSYYPDTGRLENRIHAFFVVARPLSGRVVSETGVEVQLVALGDLRERVRAGTFRHQLHVAVLATAPIFGVSLAER